MNFIAMTGQPAIVYGHEYAFHDSQRYERGHILHSEEVMEEGRFCDGTKNRGSGVAKLNKSVRVIVVRTGMVLA
jgi:hypothetical protein